MSILRNDLSMRKPLEVEQRRVQVDLGPYPGSYLRLDSEIARFQPSASNLAASGVQPAQAAVVVAPSLCQWFRGR
jgi:hypothetical protein